MIVSDESTALVSGETLRLVNQTLSVGVAVIDPDTWEVLFENANFFKWFPPTGDSDEPLTVRVPDVDTNRLLSRMERGRPYSLQMEVKVGNREIPIELEFRSLSDSGVDDIVVECRDISKQLRAEYMLESYSALAERNARELEREKDRAERLLLNIMPKSVYEEMKDYGTVTPQVYDSASILMLDFAGHTEKAISRDPAALITQLNDIFTVFDRITEMFGCERIRTVGDSYMAVSGIPDETPEHARNIAQVALRMLRYIERRNTAHPEAWHCRIGINSGPVIGSLVGVQKYVYDIFGPGVNLAARMESLSEPMKITVSENTFELLKDDFYLVERGDFEVKGFEEQTLFFLERELPHVR